MDFRYLCWNVRLNVASHGLQVPVLECAAERCQSWTSGTCVLLGGIQRVNPDSDLAHGDLLVVGHGLHHLLQVLVGVRNLIEVHRLVFVLLRNHLKIRPIFSKQV